MLSNIVSNHIIKKRGLFRSGAITLDPKQTFFYIPLPEDLKNKYTTLGQKLFGKEASEINDHITLLYLPKKQQNFSEREISLITSELGKIKLPPIQAKVQGWAYFDGADGDSGSKTALVALIDTPGLEELHVQIKTIMRNLGYDVTQNHGFNPHTTFCYLDRGDRVDNLPVLGDKFTIDTFCLATAKNYTFKLKG